MLDTATLTVNTEHNLIEVRGPVEIDFLPADDDIGDVLAFSNGVILRVQRHPKGWRIIPIEVPDEIPVLIKEIVVGRNLVVDMATISATRWVAHVKDFARRR